MKFFQSTLTTIVFLFGFSAIAMEETEITPYKYVNPPPPPYKIPPSSRFTVKREEKEAPEIVYYLTKPKILSYTITFLLEGSSEKGGLSSVIHFHRYFLKELSDLGLGVLTVEQWGIDGNTINDDEFWRHYTRTQRLKDHQTVIAFLKQKPPEEWNGKFVFLGCSEGGPLVTDLTILYPEDTIATINWVGAGDWSWQEELWGFLDGFWKKNPECIEHKIKLSDCSCSKERLSRKEYDERVEAILKDPTTDKDFCGMTYLYLADVFKRQPYDYRQIRPPFLVVAGALDDNIESTDKFVEKAKLVNVPITYERIEDMGHGIRQRPDVIEKSFKWLGEKLLMNEK